MVLLFNNIACRDLFVERQASFLASSLCMRLLLKCNSVELLNLRTYAFYGLLEIKLGAHSFNKDLMIWIARDYVVTLKEK